MNRNQVMLAEYDRGLTMAAIGEIHGISRERVRQLLKEQGRTGRQAGTDRAEAIARFWSRVKFGPDCWEWQGAINRTTGYGTFQASALNGLRYTHRIGYVLTHGAIPARLWVLHNCDNPRCVRPDHLYAGTPQQNTRDRDARGRGGSYKLTGEAARAIIASDDPIDVLAQRFGVSGNTIRRIRTKGAPNLLRRAA